MTTTLILSAYGALALGFLVHTLWGMGALRRPRREERLFGPEERILIVGAALLASAGWIVLVPIHAIGRAHLAYERRGPRSWSIPGQWRRERTIAGRAA